MFVAGETEDIFVTRNCLFTISQKTFAVLEVCRPRPLHRPLMIIDHHSSYAYL